MDTNHSISTLFGAVLASYKSVLLMISSLGFISWEMVWDTALLAAIGGAVGWGVSEILKVIKQLIKGAFLRYKNRNL